ncbi:MULTISPECIES: YbaB/EbfC family nucleoid-associated protein [Amycolatopsis]|uniref:Conserved DNA-binding protein YbaB n=2 Tax=Amycolatopsis TaxID=1813 RepID=A0A1I3NJI7_9PSEU|nr:YbaB/EbfC family nucleoid-associated protein [Amycolatopsis sacchari]SFJ09305.1 Conserved DNA-binding protein YbaB [Amycolatopsis sacchari]
MTQSAPPGGGDPVAAFTAELEEIQAKAAAAQERLRTAIATASAPDGAVSVTVGPNGALQDIRFGARAFQRPPEALSRLVMELIGRAQREVSAEVAEAFTGMVGENSTARALLDDFLPAAEDDETEDDSDTFTPEPDVVEEPPPPPRAQQPPPPRRRPSRPAPEEDDEDNSPW